LKQEKSQNPELATVIDQEIAKLEDIKRSTQNSITINKDQISQLQAANPNRPEITIGSLMSDFESKMNAIDQSPANEVDKLTRKNELNEKLIQAIEAKIEAVQEEWKKIRTMEHRIAKTSENWKN
jgi:prefoldin subunit 5